MAKKQFPFDLTLENDISTLFWVLINVHSSNE